VFPPVLPFKKNNLVRAIKSKEFDFTPEGDIYRDIRAFISLNFVSVNIVFRPRSCNKVAHALAAIGAREERISAGCGMRLFLTL
jgi:hypothetical protein